MTSDAARGTAPEGALLGPAEIRELAEAALRREHPDASPEEFRARLAVRLYGRAAVEGVLGPLPADAR